MFIHPYPYFLGIVKKHHDLLEEECHAFGQKIAKEIAKTDFVTEGELFDKYIENIRKINQGIKELKRQRSELVAKFERETSKDSKRKLKTDLIKLQTETDEKRQAEPKLIVQSGPFCAHL